MWPAAETRLAQWAERDLLWARSFHQRSLEAAWLPVFVAASRLGDGGCWYLTPILLYMFGGAADARVAGQMVVLGLVNLALYLLVKYRTARARPGSRCPDFRPCVRALDRFSFPSGHTLHAVSYAILLSWHYPRWAPLLGLFAVLVAGSRVALGLHYPSDVLAGVALGTLTCLLLLASV
jgi:undecaprenyl-diphosphatase